MQSFLCHKNVNGQFLIVLLFELPVLQTFCNMSNFFPHCTALPEVSYLLTYGEMEFQTSSGVLGMFISHYNDHALPGVIASTFITPFVYTEFYIHTTQTDNQ